MQCPQCNSPLDEDAIFCGNCGKQIAPLQARGATISVKETRQTNDGQFPRNTSYGVQGTSIPAPDAPPNLGSNSITFHSTPQPPRGNTRRLVLIVALILLLIAGGTIGIVSFLKGGSIPASNATGFVKFLDSPNSQGNTDALQININGLPTPSSGSRYNAWLVDEQSERIVSLGTLTASGQTFTLDHAGNGTNLLRAGNKLEITLEQGTVNSPTGRVVLTGVFPPK